MLDALRDRMVAYLARYRVCVISTAGLEGTWAMPVYYRNQGLDVVCWIPRWADAVYYLERNPQVLLIVRDTQAESLRWLQVWGVARMTGMTEWGGLLPEEIHGRRPEDRYVAIQVSPTRIDLVDESRGWGVRETLDL